MKTVHVAVAVIENAQGEILIAKRLDHQHMGGYWEFPGGKVEPGETLLEALRREIQEELSLHIHTAEPFLKVPFQYPDKKVLLDIWRVTSFVGEPQGCEGQRIQWVNKDCLPHYTFPPANHPILTALALSERMLITGSFSDAAECVQRVHHAILVNGIRAVQLRAHTLSKAAYQTLAQQLLPVCHSQGAKLLLNTCPEWFVAGADGLHLSSHQLTKMRVRPYGREIFVGASCHNADEIRHAHAIGVDYVSLAPVLPTATHPGLAGLGWEQLSALASCSPVPVFAMGGLAEIHLPQVKAAYAFGVAAISAWW